MHEGNFTQHIVDAVLRELEKHPGNRPREVKVRVGEMLHLLPDSVKTHYELCSAGTRLEGARLDLEEVPVVVHCQQCGHEGGVQDHHLLLCEKCGSGKVTVLAGHEVIVEAIEMELDQP